MSCAPILTGLISQAVFDRLQSTGRQGFTLWLLVGALAAMAVLDAALSVGWFWIHTTFESTIEALVRTNLFSWAVASGRRGHGGFAGRVSWSPAR